MCQNSAREIPLDEMSVGVSLIACIFLLLSFLESCVFLLLMLERLDLFHSRRRVGDLDFSSDEESSRLTRLSR